MGDVAQRVGEMPAVLAGNRIYSILYIGVSTGSLLTYTNIIYGHKRRRVMVGYGGGQRGVSRPGLNAAEMSAI